MDKCTHPEGQCKPYHDNSTVCTACNSVVEQNGKKIEPPDYLGMDAGLPVASAPTDSDKNRVIDMLIAVARAAHNLADGTCEEGGIYTIDEDDFNKLSATLDELSELPEPGLNLYGTGPAKAEAVLAS